MAQPASTQREPLTDIQTEVLRLLAEGYVYLEVAAKLNLKYRAVRKIATSARDALGASTMFEAAVAATEKGLIHHQPAV